MDQIGHRRPRQARWLAASLAGVGLAGAAQAVAAMSQSAHLTANLAAAREAAQGLADAERAISSLTASAELGLVLGILGLSGGLLAWMVYTARWKARFIAAVCGISLATGQLLLMSENVGLRFVDDVDNGARADLVNSLLIHPAYLGVLLTAQIATLVLGIAAFILTFQPAVGEFLSIRSEPAPDDEWDRAVAARRQAVELKRDSV
ncbi:hypothetical protein [Catelliglobosispora koreensis]|uniref:hypothetical protein n=1 Tax=Catelliglobosispora koreensis TaxID=129052 RepID=UPI000366A871|nr:hypothetical protein [Catelliglobosispora koreensis]